MSFIYMHVDMQPAFEEVVEKEPKMKQIKWLRLLAMQMRMHATHTLGREELSIYSNRFEEWEWVLVYRLVPKNNALKTHEILYYN